MSALGLVLVVLGGLVIYEAIKGGIGTAKAASPASAPTAGTASIASQGNASVSAAGGSLLPASWYQALYANEGDNGFPGIAFGISAFPGHPQSPSYPSGAGGTFSGAVFSSWQDAVSSLDQLLTGPLYAAALPLAKAGNCLGYFDALRAAGYCWSEGVAGGLPGGECSTWPQQVCGRV